jgi:hypothetical protein
MKKLVITSILALLIASGTALKAQDRQDDYLGLPGDNLNLYAVMNLFQGSRTLEEFERKLNDENSRINNLDLNGDNMVDYISVADHVNRGVHNIVLSVALNSFEKQDVAVFTVERFRNGSAQVQLIGDEALYGRNYIIEPIYADNDGGTLNPGYNGASGYDNNNVITTTYVEIAAWPLISYMFRPDYVIWHSSWYWDYYPTYWHPWSPFSWHFYYGYHQSWYPDYYRHYRHWDRPRYTHYNDFYYRDVRSHSRMVADRIREGNYRNTYSHPEQRRDGEALYSRTHSERNSTFSGNSTNRDRGSRSVASQNSNRSTESRSYSNSRRSNNTYTGNTRSNPSQRQNARASNRSAVTVQDRNVANRKQDQNNMVSRRSVTSAPDRTVSNRSFSQNSRINQRSSAPDRAISNRSFSQNNRINQRSSAPSSDRMVSKRELRGETASAARKSNTNVSSQNRRADREVKSGGSVRSNDRNKRSDNNGTSRRR